MGTFDDNRAATASPPLPPRRVRAVDPPARSRAAPAARAVPVRARGPGPARPGLLRGLQHPGVRPDAAAARDRRAQVVIGVSGGLDSTQALIVAARAMDRLGLAAHDILAYTMPGFGTSDDTKAQRLALMAALGVTAAELDIRPTAPLMLREMGHPFGRGEPVLRRHLRERAGRAAHRLPVPPRQPAWRHRARHRRPVRAGARLVHLRRRRPDVALQRQRRRAQDADPASDPLGDRIGAVRAAGAAHAAAPSWTPRSRPSWCPPARAPRRRAPRPRSAPTRCRTSPCSTCCATASARPSSRSWPCMAWEDAARGSWPPGFPEARRVAYDLPAIRHWMEVFLQRFFGFSPVQAVGRAERPQAVGRRRAVAAR